MPSSREPIAVSPQRRRFGGTALILVSVVVAMAGLSVASVPLYRIFCAATGYGGTTQRAEKAPDQEAAAVVVVRFNAETAPGLGWEFHPLQNAVVVHPGEKRQVYYRAVNKTAVPVTARAVYNVTPSKVGIYFDKLQCFCFSDQTLAPGQSVDMGVLFFVDPDILNDPDTREVRSITLSYTIFRAAGAGSPSAQTVSAGPAPARSAKN